MFNLAFIEFKEKIFSNFPGIRNTYVANHDFNRWNMKLPNAFIPYIDQIFLNARIYDFLKTLNWESLYIAYLSSDIASPGSKYQQFHQDGDYFGLAVNIPLVNTSKENGATEIVSNLTKKEKILSESKVLTMEIGDLSIRDIRTIHRGTTNNTNTERPYISVIILEAEELEIPPDNDLHEIYRRYKRLKSELLRSKDSGSIDYANEIGRSLINLAKTDRLLDLPSLSDYSNISKEFHHLFRYSDSSQRCTIKRNFNQTQEIFETYPEIGSKN